MAKSLEDTCLSHSGFNKYTGGSSSFVNQNIVSGQ